MSCALLLAVLGGAAAPAAAAGRLHLTWGDCWQGGAASASAAFACDDNLGEHALFAAFVLDQPVDSLIGIEVVVDLQIAAAALPDWWQFAAGGCRENALGADVAVSPFAACANPWGTTGTALVQSYAPGEPRGGPGQARIRAVVAVVPSDSARSLASGTPYHGLRLLLRHTRTMGLGACDGCMAAGCLVLNSMVLRRLPGGTGDVVLDTPGAGNANRATWQGVGADCTAVPVARRTWGQIKQLFR